MTRILPREKMRVAARRHTSVLSAVLHEKGRREHLQKGGSMSVLLGFAVLAVMRALVCVCACIASGRSDRNGK